MITYRVTLDVPLQLVVKVSNLLRKRPKELGTRNGTRALTCYQQAVFILAWFRDRPGDIAKSVLVLTQFGHKMIS